jgi:hypothetical protein|uniref:Uncharacterized protein n=1 Tax=Desulfomonile tiedjei TaxID=2358 RepID=A0A7C4ATI2_9BACT
MPRYLILVLFCGVLAAAFLGSASVAIANDGSDGSKNFKQPNLKPYENLASVLKASYKTNSSSKSGTVAKKPTTSSKSPAVKKNTASAKSSYHKTKTRKSSHSASNSKKKNHHKPKTTKKPA